MHTTSYRQEESSGTISLRTRGLEKTYGRGESTVRALRGVNFEAHRGSFTAIMGPSGSGKSTFLHLLAALDTPQAGEVWIDGEPVSQLGDRKRTLLRRHTIGFVFQTFNLLPELTARENILLSLQLAGVEGSVDELAEELSIEDRLDHYPSELSGGQAQRVAIARALITQPAIIFADEPTGALDIRTGQDILAAMRHAVDKRGQTLVMVTHDPVAAAYADRVVLLVDGQIGADLVSPDIANLNAALERFRK